MANNHGAFAQQSLISPQKSPPSHQPPTPGGVPMSFYSKRDAVPSSNAVSTDCYTPEPALRTRPSDYMGWTNPPASNWTDMPLQTTPPAPHPAATTESLPSAHNLLQYTSKDSSATVITNQNGKTFAAPSTTAGYPRYDQSQQMYTQTQYPLKRGASYSGPRPPYLDNAGAMGMSPMDYMEGRTDVGFQQPPHPHTPTDAHFSAYNRAPMAMNGMPRSKPGPGRPRFQPHLPPGADSTGNGSPAGSLASSDGETTTSSRGGTSITLSASGQQQKKPRKPAPTLATGRRNLKSEPVS